MSEQWERALARAALREVGYDAVGARDAVEARRYRAVEPLRGAVALVLIDHDAAASTGDDLRRIVATHRDPPVVLIAHRTHKTPAGRWRTVLYRPLTVADLVTAVQSVLPLPEDASRPLDVED